MYGRLGLFYHLHLNEALAQRRRLARSSDTGPNAAKPRPSGFRASTVIFGLTVATLALLLAVSLAIRLSIAF